MSFRNLQLDDEVTFWIREQPARTPGTAANDRGGLESAAAVAIGNNGQVAEEQRAVDPDRSDEASRAQGILRVRNRRRDRVGPTQRRALDIASQFGLRFPLPANDVVGELTFRHRSNGIRLPNHGQDSVTLTVRLNPGLVGVDKTEQIAVDGLVNPLGAPAVENAGAASLPRARKQLHRVLNGKFLELPTVLEPI